MRLHDDIPLTQEIALAHGYAGNIHHADVDASSTALMKELEKLSAVLLRFDQQKNGDTFHFHDLPPDKQEIVTRLPEALDQLFAVYYQEGEKILQALQKIRSRLSAHPALERPETEEAKQLLRKELENGKL